MSTPETLDQEPRHPIRVVSERTGLSPDVLRAWEKRYAAVQPPRRDGAGQRLYSDADVERLRLLRRVTQAGRSIGQVAELTTGELAALAREDETERTVTALAPPPAQPGPARGYLDRAMEEARRLDGSGLEAVLRRAMVALRADEFVDDVAVPFLRAIGEEWEAGTLGVAHEHMSSAVMRRVLSLVTDTFEPEEGAPEVVIATPSRQQHELGALLAAAAAAASGWSVTFLGADLPAEEIAAAARQRGAAAVALSIVYPVAGPDLVDEVRRLRRALPASVPLVVGGAGARRVEPLLDEPGIAFLPSLAEFRRRLTQLTLSPGTRHRNGRG